MKKASPENEHLIMAYCELNLLQSCWEEHEENLRPFSSFSLLDHGWFVGHDAEAGRQPHE
jgi:hypothetical protein